MALKDSITGREFDKFAPTTDGGTVVKVSTVAGGTVAGSLVSVSGSADVTTAETVLIQKQTLDGRTGSWFVYNSGNVAVDVNMYSAYISGAANFTTATGSTQWDKVGSTQSIAAGNTKHIPFNNVYRYVALAASTSAGTATGTAAELYAL
jgi:hypothetical protein|tara:strand:+ start:488 stop:937 length:450 start_codon:yes stop_codon:yes gene_type:complete